MSGKGKGKRSLNGGARAAGEASTSSQNGDILLKKRLKHKLNLSSVLLQEESKAKLREAWTDQEGKDDVAVAADVTVIKHPFTVCSVKGLADNADQVNDLALELQDLEFKVKNNDLYKFKQSADLRHTGGFESVRAMRDLMREEVREQIANARSTK